MPKTLAARPLLLAALLILPLSPTPAAAAPEAESMLVSPDWLEAHLVDPDLVVLHVGRKGEYESEGHLPGARLLPFRDLHLAESQGLRDELPPLDAMRAVFESLGIGDASRIVLCPTDESSLYLSGRILLALDLLGLGDNTRLLDGGLPLWIGQGGELSTTDPAARQGKITLEPRPEFMVSAAWISERLGDADFRVVDARPEGAYTGHEPDHHAKRQGHVAGALNAPFYELAREDEPVRLLPAAELRSRFDGAAPGATVAVYCGTGIWAGQAYLAARVLGLDARFYDGSYQEWSADESLPITAPVNPDLVE